LPLPWPTPARLLESSPELAAEQAAEILKSAPNHPLATLLLGVARRVGGDAKTALQALEPARRPPSPMGAGAL